MHISRLFQRALLGLIMAGAATSASAFSILGPFALDPFNVYQVPRAGYLQPGGSDIGGPLNLGEEYRWNIRTITYGFEESFLNYFGQRGVVEINKAFAILNALPPVSKMTANLTEFPTHTKRVNHQASALGLLDLKSIVLGTLLEEMGLGNHERFTWTLRSVRDDPPFIFYNVIKRNFDPVTLAPSSYVNGTLYSYVIIDPVAIFNGTPVADAVEISVDPLAFQFTSVASSANPVPWTGGGLFVGEFFTGITREDAGSLRYLYRPTNYNIESLITNTTGSSASPWTPVGATNSAVDIALRPGVDKILFKQVKYDSELGNFIPMVQQYKDTYITNSHRFKQRTQRGLVQPDIVFGAADIGAPVTDLNPTLSRSIAWVNNDILNGQVLIGGPGIISPQIAIILNKVGPANLNINPFSLDEANVFIQDFRWGSFDGTTNAPIVYPLGSSIEELEQQVLGGN